MEQIYGEATFDSTTCGGHPYAALIYEAASFMEQTCAKPNSKLLVEAAHHEQAVAHNASHWRDAIDDGQHESLPLRDI